MHKLWRSAAECLVASLIALLLTVVCYRMHLNLATASLLYVIVIVLVSDVALCLFRVLQEALHNAGKHSGERQFDVQLSGTSNEIHLRVSDCGVGFSLATARTGRELGLNGMQDRPRLLKGSLSIDSLPKRRTTLHARVPFTASSDSALAEEWALWGHR
jgi:signal transduction histidine kinase